MHHKQSFPRLLLIATMVTAFMVPEVGRSQEARVTEAKLDNAELAIKTKDPANAVRVTFGDDPKKTHEQEKPSSDWRFDLPKTYKQGTKVSVEVGIRTDEGMVKYFAPEPVEIQAVEPELQAEVRGNSLLIRINGRAGNVKVSLAKDGAKPIPLEDAVLDKTVSAWKTTLPSDVDFNRKAHVGFDFYGKTEEATITIWFPPIPSIVELKPRAGGKEGDVITIVGRNFGTSSKDIRIILRENEQAEDFDGIFRSLTNPDPDGQQELSFEIPPDAGMRSLLSNNTYLSVEVNSQRSNERTVTVVAPYWQFKCALISLVIVVVVLIPVVWSVRSLPMVHKKWTMVFFFLFLDKKTNKYSLSKFQAFGWTVLLLGSYFYLALGKGLIIGFTGIPDFNPSLVVLMTVSYGGLVASRSLANRNARNDLEGSPRNFSNLFMEGGEVSLPRLQLFGFTMITWVVYAGYMFFSADVFENGLPDVPQNLLALLGVSQGGFIGGRMVAGRLAVNLIVPRRISTEHKDKVKVVPTGTGFLENTKVMFGNDNDLIQTKRENENALSFELDEPESRPNRAPGWNQLAIVPPTGSIVVIEDAIQFVIPKLDAEVSADRKKLTLKLEGFSLEDLVCKVDNELIKRDPQDLELAESEEDVIKTAKFVSDSVIKAGKAIVVSSSDGYVKATGQTSAPPAPG